MSQQILLGLWLLACLSATAPLPPPEPNPPSWPSSVTVLGPEDDVGNLTARIAALLSELNNVTTGHYSSDRKALLFKPGKYDAEIKVGYYVQVLGLGERPEDVEFASAWGVYSEPMGAIPDPGSLDNFWRSAENFRHASPWGMLWAVSQASPIRRIRVDKDLELSRKGAWASGGYMADIQVGGMTKMGGQQQWMIRNSNISTPDAADLGGQWNLVLVGCTGGPRETLPADGSKIALTNVALTPVVAEKPYITIDALGRYSLQVPKPKFRSVGPAVEATTSVPFEQVFVARAEDTSSAIQAKLNTGLHVLLSPGIYHLSAPLTLSFKDQVLLGIGMATLVAPNDGSPCVFVESAATGARVAGIVLQAAFSFHSQSAQLKRPQSSLLEWGRPGETSGDPGNPGVLSDVFARVGGPDTDRSIGLGAMSVLSVGQFFVDCCGIQINSDPRPTINPDGSINFHKWHELIKDSKLPYMTFDPPQKKAAFAQGCRNCYFAPPRAWICATPPCCATRYLQQKYGPFKKFQISKDDWLPLMLERDNPHCPDFLRGIWWMKDNIANETLLTFQDAAWRPDGRFGTKDTGTNWSTGTNLLGSLLASIKKFPAGFQVEPGANPKWVGLTNGDDWIYVLGEEDKGKLLYPDGTPVDFIVGEDLLRVSVSGGDPYTGVFYQYLVKRVAFKDCDGKVVKTQYFDELVERATRPTVDGCCCNLFLCTTSDEDYGVVYDSLDDTQLIVYNQDKYPPAPSQ
ncbi:unnamed protein product [Symbiodinium natans]|uniref:Uncharacterized protein n=1 Tax=Symbiodinium natans TaxID=878477 RepID=A0A812PRX4_9DINO|nr:unnamed protein product [Symbiodinium natans]